MRPHPRNRPTRLGHLVYNRGREARVHKKRKGHAKTSPGRGGGGQRCFLFAQTALKGGFGSGTGGVGGVTGWGVFRSGCGWEPLLYGWGREVYEWRGRRFRIHPQNPLGFFWEAGRRGTRRVQDCKKWSGLFPGCGEKEVVVCHWEGGVFSVGDFALRCTAAVPSEEGAC